MNSFWKQLRGPLSSIRDQPWQFVVWLIVADVIGLAGFLVPMLVSWAFDKSASAAFLASVKGGSLASFCVVLLAEGIAATLVASPAGTNIVAVGMRGVVSVLAIVIIIVQAVFLAAQSVAVGESPAPKFQLGLTAAAIVFAAYLYCFRFGTWEKGVDVVQAEDDQAVEDLAKSAQETTADGSGVKL